MRSCYIDKEDLSINNNVMQKYDNKSKKKR